MFIIEKNPVNPNVATGRTSIACVPHFICIFTKFHESTIKDLKFLMELRKSDFCSLQNWGIEDSNNGIQSICCSVAGPAGRPPPGTPSLPPATVRMRELSAGAAAGAMRAVCPYVAAPQGSSRKWIRPSSDSGPRRAKSDPWACCLQAQSCKQISKGLGRTTRYEDGMNGSP